MRRLEYETRTGLSRAKEQTEGRGVGAVSATPPRTVRREAPAAQSPAAYSNENLGSNLGG